MKNFCLSVNFRSTVRSITCKLLTIYVVCTVLRTPYLYNGYAYMQIKGSFDYFSFRPTIDDDGITYVLAARERRRGVQLRRYVPRTLCTECSVCRGGSISLQDVDGYPPWYHIVWIILSVLYRSTLYNHVQYIHVICGNVMRTNLGAQSLESWFTTGAVIMAKIREVCTGTIWRFTYRVYMCSIVRSRPGVLYSTCVCMYGGPTSASAQVYRLRASTARKFLLLPSHPRWSGIVYTCTEHSLLVTVQYVLPHCKSRQRLRFLLSKGNIVPTAQHHREWLRHKYAKGAVALWHERLSESDHTPTHNIHKYLIRQVLWR